MNYNFVTNIEACYSNIPSLIYYSHIPTAAIALFFGFFVYFQAKQSRDSVLLLISTALFSVWSATDLVIWLSPNSSFVFFSWSIINLLEILTSLSIFYFAYHLFQKKFPPFTFNFLVSLLVISYSLLIPTALNLRDFNYSICEATQGPLINLFYFIEVFTLFSLTVFLITRIIRKSEEVTRLHIIIFSLGAFLFAFSFSGTNLIGSLLAQIYPDNPDNWKVIQYGLLTMPIFMAFLVYNTIKYKTFNIKLAAPIALVFGLWGLVFSLLFVHTIQTIQIIVGATLVFVVGFGLALIKSIRLEIKQREELELLTQALEKANVRLKELDKQKSEFVSIASHQLRSPLTAMRGYASMLVEGSFGKIPEKALEAAKRIDDSAKLMAMSVEDYLNVSRIESGNMKYNLSDFNVKEMTEKICDDLRPEALKSNLILLFRTDLKSRAIVNADVGKTNQIIHNLINNSIKYTPKGTINVFMRDDLKKKRIYVDITDTGIGMSQATIHTLFQKFSRADNANSVNVSGTGLGLYVAFKMAEQMGGTITCASEGDGKGSTFTFELPLAM